MIKEKVSGFQKKTFILIAILIIILNINSVSAQLNINEKTIELNRVVPTFKTWKLFNYTKGITDYITTKFIKISDTEYYMVLKSDKDLKDRITEANTLTDYKQASIDFFNDEKYYTEILASDKIPVNILGKEENYNFLQHQQIYHIELPEWKEGLNVSIGFNTEYWTTTTQCTINNSRTDVNLHIIATCDVSIENGATWTMIDSRLGMNLSSDSQYDLNFTHLSEINWTNASIYEVGNEHTHLFLLNGNGTMNNCTIDSPTGGGASYTYFIPEGHANITIWGLDSNYRLRFWGRQNPNITINDTLIDASRNAELYLNSFYTYNNVKIGNGAGTEYFMVKDDTVVQGGELGLIIDSGGVNYVDLRIYAQAGETVQFMGLIDMPDYETLDFSETGGQFRRFFPMWVYDDNDGITPVSGATVEIKNESDSTVIWTGSTDSLGNVNPNVTYIYENCDKDFFQIITGVYIENEWKGNFTCENDTFPKWDFNTSAEVDNPPNANNQYPPDKSDSSTGIISHICNVTDDINLDNVSLLTNISGAWAINDTNTSGLSGVNYTFNINYSIDSNYTLMWSCCGVDNSSQSGCSNNWTIDMIIEGEAPVTPVEAGLYYFVFKGFDWLKALFGSPQIIYGNLECLNC